MRDSSKPYRVKNMILKKLELNNEQKIGTIDVTVYDVGTQNPISNAIVYLYLVTVAGTYNEIGEGVLIESHVTDENGKIPNIKLLITESLDVRDRTVDPRIRYHMIITAPGYYSAIIVNLQLQVFPDITTSINVNLNPIQLGTSKFFFHITPDIQDIQQLPSIPN